MDDIILKKIGVVFSPPAVILLYADNGTYKKRSMPLRDLTVSCDAYQVATRLKTRHKKQLQAVNLVRLEKLVRLAQESLKGKDKISALKMIESEFVINPAEDLNKLTDKELQRRKDIMDLNFAKKNVTKEHPDFVYDKQVEFGGEKVSNDWDTESEVSEKIDNIKMTSTEKKIVVEKEKVKKIEAEPPEPQSNGSTPINSPIQERQALSSATKNIFGLASSASSDEGSEALLPQPKIGLPPLRGKEEPKENKSLSAGEVEDEDDDFW